MQYIMLLVSLTQDSQKSKIINEINYIEGSHLTDFDDDKLKLYIFKNDESKIRNFLQSLDHNIKIEILN